MSVIDTNVNTVVSYVSGVTKALSGQRLASFSWKTSKENGIKRESKAVSIPKLDETAIAAHLPLLMPHIVVMLEEVQNKIVREMLEANSGLLHLENSAIDMTAIVDYLEDSNESGRLTKESVGSWFDTTIADSLMLALAEKMGIESEQVSDAQAKQIEALVGQFKVKISALAGGQTSYPIKLAQSLQKVIALAPENDLLACRFNQRLVKMIQSSDSDSLINAL
jgi:hypothetical protein